MRSIAQSYPSGIFKMRYGKTRKLAYPHNVSLRQPKTNHDHGPTRTVAAGGQAGDAGAGERAKPSGITAGATGLIYRRSFLEPCTGWPTIAVKSHLQSSVQVSDVAVAIVTVATAAAQELQTAAFFSRSADSRTKTQIR